MEEEREILARRSERKQDAVSLTTVVDDVKLMEMRQVVEEVYVDPDIQQYIVQIVAKTRKHRQVELGVSPRGSLALLKLSRAWAAILAREYVIPDDIKTFAQPVLGHRVILDPNLWGTKKAERAVIEEIIQSVPVPVISQP
jgi:MoxR-like ATPase